MSRSIGAAIGVATMLVTASAFAELPIKESLLRYDHESEFYCQSKHLDSGVYYFDWKDQDKITIEGFPYRLYQPDYMLPLFIPCLGHSHGISIAANSTVALCIPAGKTLEVVGSKGYSAADGSGCGIHVPASSTLILFGDGKVIARGGDAGNGSKGGDGGKGRADHVYSGSTDSYSGPGGNGGAGGGGGGAGIGGKGGTGGGGGGGGNKDGHGVKDVRDISWSSGMPFPQHGLDATGGNPGNSGELGGTVYVLGSVAVEASTGAGGGGGGGGSYGDRDTVSHTSTMWFTSCGGGGGGGGGGGRAAAWGIGGGGTGGGGGGGGGGGAMIYRYTVCGRDYDYRYPNVTGMGGAGGRGNASGASGKDNRGGGYNSTDSSDSYYRLYSWDSAKGEYRIRAWADSNGDGWIRSGRYGDSGWSNASSADVAGIYHSAKSEIKGRNPHLGNVVETESHSELQFTIHIKGDFEQDVKVPYGGIPPTIFPASFDDKIFMGCYTSTGEDGQLIYTSQGTPWSRYYYTSDITCYAIYKTEAEIERTGVTINGVECGIGSGTGWFWNLVSGEVMISPIAGSQLNYEYLVRGTNDNSRVKFHFYGDATLDFRSLSIKESKGIAAYSTIVEVPKGIKGVIRLWETNELKVAASAMASAIQIESGGELMITNNAVYPGSTLILNGGYGCPAISPAGWLKVMGGRTFAYGGVAATAVGTSSQVFLTSGRFTMAGGTFSAKAGDGQATDIGASFGYSGSGLITEILGGSLRCVKSPPAVNSAVDRYGRRVHCVRTAVPDCVTDDLPVEITGGPFDDYGVDELYPIDGRLYLWCVNGNHDFYVNGFHAYADVNDADTDAYYLTTGVRVDGQEVGTAAGEGWRWSPSSSNLVFTQVGATHRIAGENIKGEVHPVIDIDQELTLSDLNLTAYGLRKGVIEIEKGAKVKLKMFGRTKLAGADGHYRGNGIAVDQGASVELTAADNAGELLAVAGHWGAGIGGALPALGSGIVTVKGPLKLTATGGFEGAGIGGAAGVTNGTYLVSGSPTVTAISGQGAEAAIGNGRWTRQDDPFPVSTEEVEPAATLTVASLEESALKAALKRAESEGGRVTFAEGLEGEIVLTNDLAINTSRAVTIDGDGRITLVKYGIVAHGAGKLSLYGLTLKGEEFTRAVDGGMIRVRGDALIQNCTFSKCRAMGYGGAIYSSGEGTLEIVNCAFTDCESLRSGGAVFARGKLIVERSSFTRCRATYAGGAIGSYAPNTQIVTEHCSFLDNVAGERGGGLDAGAPGVLIAAADTFADNAGGGVYAEDELYALSTLAVGNRGVLLDRAENIDVRGEGFEYRVTKDQPQSLVFVEDANRRSEVKGVEHTYRKLAGKNKRILQGAAIWRNAGWNTFGVGARVTDAPVRVYGTGTASMRCNLDELESEVTAANLQIGAVMQAAESEALTVTTSEDRVDPEDGEISLREAIRYAASEDTPERGDGYKQIYLAPALFVATNTVELVITNTLTIGAGVAVAISGPGGANTAVVAARAGVKTLFSVEDGAALELSMLEFARAGTEAKTIESRGAIAARDCRFDGGGTGAFRLKAPQGAVMLERCSFVDSEANLPLEGSVLAVGGYGHALMCTFANNRNPYGSIVKLAESAEFDFLGCTIVENVSYPTSAFLHNLSLNQTAMESSILAGNTSNYSGEEPLERATVKASSGAEVFYGGRMEVAADGVRRTYYRPLKDGAAYCKGEHIFHDQSWRNIAVGASATGYGKVALRGYSGSTLLRNAIDIAGREIIDRYVSCGSYATCHKEEYGEPGIIIVTTPEDTPTDQRTIDDEFTDEIELREAVNFATANAAYRDSAGNCRITFADSFWQGQGEQRINWSMCQIEIGEGFKYGKLTIAAPDERAIILDGGKTYRHFAVGPGQQVELNNLNFVNGQAGAFGHNGNDHRGGSIWNAGYLTVSNCAFRGNSAGRFQGELAGHADGGAVATLSGGETLLCASTFVTNVATYGGAVRTEEGGKTAAVACTFIGNRAEKGSVTSPEGGAVSANGESQTALVSCTITGNRSETLGGGVSAKDAPPGIANLALIDTVAVGNEIVTGVDEHGADLYAHNGTKIYYSAYGERDAKADDVWFDKSVSGGWTAAAVIATNEVRVAGVTHTVCTLSEEVKAAAGGAYVRGSERFADIAYGPGADHSSWLPLVGRSAIARRQPTMVRDQLGREVTGKALIGAIGDGPLPVAAPRRRTIAPKMAVERTAEAPEPGAAETPTMVRMAAEPGEPGEDGLVEPPEPDEPPVPEEPQEAEVEYRELPEECPEVIVVTTGEDVTGRVDVVSFRDAIAMAALTNVEHGASVVTIRFDGGERAMSVALKQPVELALPTNVVERTIVIDGAYGTNQVVMTMDALATEDEKFRNYDLIEVVGGKRIGEGGEDHGRVNLAIKNVAFEAVTAGAGALHYRADGYLLVSNCMFSTISHYLDDEYTNRIECASGAVAISLNCDGEAMPEESASAAKAVFVDCAFLGCTGDEGAAINAVIFDSLTVVDSVFAAGVAYRENKTGDGAEGTGYGGALFVQNGRRAAVVRTTLTDNFAFKRGGAIAVADESRLRWETGRAKLMLAGVIADHNSVGIEPSEGDSPRDVCAGSEGVEIFDSNLTAVYGDKGEVKNSQLTAEIGDYLSGVEGKALWDESSEIVRCGFPPYETATNRAGTVKVFYEGELWTNVAVRVTGESELRMLAEDGEETEMAGEWNEKRLDIFGNEISATSMRGAIFEPGAMRIRLDAQGGGFTDEKDEYIALIGVIEETEMQCPKLSGFDFEGWYSRPRGEGVRYFDGGGTQLVAIAAAALPEQRLYAKWSVRDDTFIVNTVADGELSDEAVTLRRAVERANRYAQICGDDEEMRSVRFELPAGVRQIELIEPIAITNLSGRALAIDGRSGENEAVEITLAASTNLAEESAVFELAGGELKLGCLTIDGASAIKTAGDEFSAVKIENCRLTAPTGKKVARMAVGALTISRSTIEGDIDFAAAVNEVRDSTWFNRGETQVAEGGELKVEHSTVASEVGELKDTITIDAEALANGGEISEFTVSGVVERCCLPRLIEANTNGLEEAEYAGSARDQLSETPMSAGRGAIRGRFTARVSFAVSEGAEAVGEATPIDLEIGRAPRQDYAAPVLKLPGVVFDGWWTEPGGGGRQLWDENGTATRETIDYVSEMTVYPKWALSREMLEVDTSSDDGASGNTFAGVVRAINALGVGSDIYRITFRDDIRKVSFPDGLIVNTSSQVIIDGGNHGVELENHLTAAGSRLILLGLTLTNGLTVASGEALAVNATIMSGAAEQPVKVETGAKMTALNSTIEAAASGEGDFAAAGSVIVSEESEGIIVPATDEYGVKVFLPHETAAMRDGAMRVFHDIEWTAVGYAPEGGNGEMTMVFGDRNLASFEVKNDECGMPVVRPLRGAFRGTSFYTYEFDGYGRCNYASGGSAQALLPEREGLEFVGWYDHAGRCVFNERGLLELSEVPYGIGERLQARWKLPEARLTVTTEADGLSPADGKTSLRGVMKVIEENPESTDRRVRFAAGVKTVKLVEPLTFDASAEAVVPAEIDGETDEGAVMIEGGELTVAGAGQLRMKHLYLKGTVNVKGGLWIEGANLVGVTLKSEENAEVTILRSTLQQGEIIGTPRQRLVIGFSTLMGTSLDGESICINCTELGLARAPTVDYGAYRTSAETKVMEVAGVEQHYVDPPQDESQRGDYIFADAEWRNVAHSQYVMGGDAVAIIGEADKAGGLIMYDQLERYIGEMCIGSVSRPRLSCHVTCADDSVSGSGDLVTLRDAINNAMLRNVEAGSDDAFHITFDDSLYLGRTATIRASAALVGERSGSDGVRVVMEGPTDGRSLVLELSGAETLFGIGAGRELVFRNMTIRYDAASYPEGRFLTGSGKVRFENCAFTGWRRPSASKSVVLKGGRMELFGCAIFGNGEGGGDIGAWEFGGGSTVLVENTTVSDNRTSGSGIFILDEGSTLYMLASTWTNNMVGGGAILVADGESKYHIVSSIMLATRPITGSAEGRAVEIRHQFKPSVPSMRRIDYSAFYDLASEAGTQFRDNFATNLSTRYVGERQVFSSVTGGRRRVNGVTKSYYPIMSEGLAYRRGAYIWHDAGWENIAFRAKPSSGTKSAVVGTTTNAKTMEREDGYGRARDTTVAASMGAYAEDGDIERSGVPGRIEVTSATNSKVGSASGFDGVLSLREAVETAICYPDWVDEHGVTTITFSDEAFGDQSEAMIYANGFQMEITNLHDRVLRIVGRDDMRVILNGAVSKGSSTRHRLFYVAPGCRVELEKLEFTNAVASTLGRAIKTYGGGAIYNAGEVVVSNCVFAACDANSAGGNGGAVFTAAGGRTEIFDSTIAGGAAVRGGGIANAAGATNVLVNVTLMDNRAEYVGVSGAGGGAVYAAGGGRTVLANCTLARNRTASTNGGGVFVDGAATAEANAYLVNTIVLGNLARGGAETNDVVVAGMAQAQSCVIGKRAPCTDAHWSPTEVAEQVAVTDVFARTDYQRLPLATVAEVGMVRQRIFPLRVEADFAAVSLYADEHWENVGYAQGPAGSVKVLYGLLRYVRQRASWLDHDQVGGALAIPLMGSVEVREAAAEPTPPPVVVNPLEVKLSEVEALMDVMAYAKASQAQAMGGVVEISFAPTVREIELGETTIVIEGYAGKVRVRGPIRFERATNGAFAVAPGQELELMNVTFSECEHPSRGGAVYVDGGELTVTNCVFDCCRALAAEGGGYGGALTFEGERARGVVIDSRFAGCRAQGASPFEPLGNAVYCDGDGVCFKDVHFDGEKVPAEHDVDNPLRVRVERASGQYDYYYTVAAATKEIRPGDKLVLLDRDCPDVDARSLPSNVEVEDQTEGVTFAAAMRALAAAKPVEEGVDYIEGYELNGGMIRPTLNEKASPEIVEEGQVEWDDPDKVAVRPKNIKPGLYYGLGRCDTPSGEYVVETWVKADSDGKLATALTAPKVGQAGYYRVIVK